MTADVRAFVEERLEGYLPEPVEYVRAARAADEVLLGDLAAQVRTLARLDREEMGRIREVYVRAARIVGDFADTEPVDETALTEPAEHELYETLRAELPADTRESRIEWTASLAPVLERFFEDVLVMHEIERLKTNRLRLLRDVRDRVRRTMGDLAQIPG
jgi:glycyl-tRNA synthetase beta chain